MSATSKPALTPDLFADELDREIEESLKNPEYRAAFEDSGLRHQIIDTLVSMRLDRGLTQKEVARRMGVGQPTISGFENEGSDPRLSTIQRYARAVEARCRMRIDVTPTCDWITHASAYESEESTRSVRVDSSAVPERYLRLAG